MNLSVEKEINGGEGGAVVLNCGDCGKLITAQDLKYKLLRAAGGSETYYCCQDCARKKGF